MKNGIEIFSEKIAPALEKYIEKRDVIFNSNIVEVAGDLSRGVNLLISLNNIRVERQLISFFKGFCPNKDVTDAQIDKLAAYINNEKKAQFISDTLSKLLLAKSPKCCMIIGAMIGELIEGKDDLPIEYIICINGVTELFDHEIEYIKYINNLLNNNIEGQENYHFGLLIENDNFRVTADKHGIDFNGLLYTIDKLVKLQYMKVERYVGVDADEHETLANLIEYHLLNEIGKLLYLNIDKLKL